MILEKKRMMYLILLLLIPLAHAFEGPTLSLTEEANAYYNLDGSLNASINMLGHVDVLVPNPYDVLHNVDVTLKNTLNTDLASTRAYRATAASPFNDATKLFLTTTQGTCTDYVIDDSLLSPMIYYSEFDYFNQAGGKDISQQKENNFTFSFSFYSSQFIDDVTLNIRTKTNNYNQSDSMNIYAASATSGDRLVRYDSDNDDEVDAIYWEGPLTSNPVTIEFKASITPDTHFNESERLDDPNALFSYPIVLSYDKDKLFSSVDIQSKFSRAPIRQGLEWFHTDTWYVRGFLHNPSHGLTYEVEDYSLYDKNNNLVLAHTLENDTLISNATVYSNVYPNASKSDYYSPSFEWQVLWNQSQDKKTAIFNGYRKFPELKEMYVTLTKDISEISKRGTTRVVNVKDTIRHIGHPDLEVKYITHISYINPPWFIDNTTFNIYYKDSNGTIIEVTDDCFIDYKQPESPGYVYFEYDILNKLGKTLKINEDMILTYNVYTNDSKFNVPYSFSAEAEMTTLSGTDSSAPYDRVIEYTPPREPTREYARFKTNFSTPWVDDSLDANIHISELIVDPNKQGVNLVEISVLIPKNSVLEFIKIFDKKLETRYVGNRTRNNIQYDEYLVNLDGTFYNGDAIDLKYKAKIPAGTHNLITIFRGQDIHNSVFISDTITEILNIKGIIEYPLDVKSDLHQGPAYVNDLVKWYQTVTVSNYNTVDVRQYVYVEIFSDTVQAYLLHPDAVCCTPGEKLEIVDRSGKKFAKLPIDIDRLKSENYVMLLYTPPVFELERTIIPIESYEDYAIFLINSSLENSALEDYVNIRDIYDLDYDKIIETSPNLQYWQYGNEVLINMSFLARQPKQVWIKYNASLPLMYINLNQREFDCNDLINITTMFVSPEDINLAHTEFEIIGPDYFPVNIYGDAYLYSGVSANQVVKENIYLKTNELPSGTYTIYSRFRKGFFTIINKEKTFEVNCKQQMSKIFIYFLLIVIISILSFRIYEGINYKIRKRWYRKIRKFTRYLMKKYDKF